MHFKIPKVDMTWLTWLLEYRLLVTRFLILYHEGIQSYWSTPWSPERCFAFQGDNTKPTVHLVRKDSQSTSIYQLDAARLRLIIKVPVMKKPALKVILTTNSTAGKLSICQMALVSRGKCISCTGEDVIYTNFTGDRFNRHKAELNLGKVLNTNCEYS